MIVPLRVGSARCSFERPSPRGAGPLTTTVAVAALLMLPLAPALIEAGNLPSSWGLVGVPVESLLVLLLLVVVPGRIPRGVLAGLFGAFVTAALVLAGVDRGFRSALGTGFIATDWPQLGDAYGVLAGAVGAMAAELFVAIIVVLAVLCAVVLALAALHVACMVRERTAARTALAGVTVGWMVVAFTAPSFAAAASMRTIEAAVMRTDGMRAAQARVERAIGDDPFADVPADRLLAGLRGKDVVVAFVESYGRVALEGRGIAPGVTSVLEDGGASLAAQGYAMRSAWLTSPTFGGRSWLAHATLQTGVWTDTQSAYDQVVAGHRLSLARIFGRAGWNTVSDVPSDTRQWDVGTSFYGYDTLLDATDVGYHGPTFGYALVPDQYTLKHFADAHLTRPHAPVMAEIDLVSSHTPWAPLPQLVPWDRSGDGSVYAGQSAAGESADAVWQSAAAVQRSYGRSVQYSLGALLSFLGHIDDPDLVLIVVGDHQPAPIVSGADASRDVPISVIARDRAVFAAIADWGWSPGLLPGDTSPVWRMDAFRDRLLAAFSPSS